MPKVRSALSRHRTIWAGCKRCELHKQKRRAVLTDGPANAPILVIGEAPGASEDCIGKPFIGPAGHLLRRILDDACGPLDYLLTNLVACFPREAKKAKKNEPPEECIKACLPRLEELFDLVKPELTILVGNLTQKWIPKFFGYDHSKAFAGVIHPAAILRAGNSGDADLMVKRTIAIIQTAVEEHVVPF